ncbi:cytidylate kinase family protein [Patescibacteria group bacterium]|nr:cytidylate kinase family protein [Patescibacteria group bacterium]MBU1921774.1 cytidylate kinase family protein [Patescibacteria group bacterium]
MIISFSGPPGSGKSTIAKMFAQYLDWPRYYVGQMRRQAAAKRGMTLEEYNKLGETDPSTDREVDEWMKELGAKQDNFIIEGRTAWHFIPHSLKIYVDVEEKTGAQRILNQLKSKQRKKEAEKFETIDQIMTVNRQRMASDKKRYKKYYGIDAFNKKNYDLVADTTSKTKEQTFDEIWAFIEPRLKK